MTDPVWIEEAILAAAMKAIIISAQTQRGGDKAQVKYFCLDHIKE